MFTHGAVLWGAQVSGSATGAREVEIKGYAKVNSVDYPYTVANEYVGSQIANRIGGLPVPIGALVEGEASGQPPAWASLAFSTDKPAPIDPAQGMKDIPNVLTGVLVFDVLIANQDRHAGNLRYAPSRKQAYAFDHSHALLGVDPDAGAHLAAVKNELVIDKHNPNRHCLLDHVANPNEVLGWVEEIAGAISEVFIKRICEELARLDIGVDAALATQLRIFLSHRRAYLKKIVLDNKGEFKAIDASDWPML